MRYVLAGIAALLLAWPVEAAAATSPSYRAAQWLASGQQADGRFSGTEHSNSTAQTLAALVAGGITGSHVTKALDYVRAHGRDDATEGAFTGEIIAGVVAGGQNPRSYGGTDYVALLRGQYNSSTGSYDPKNFFSNLIAVNGANAAKESLPAKAVDHVRSGQCSDGGFGSLGCSSGGSDVDATAWAINVLVASGHIGDTAVTKAHTFLLKAQQPDGGFAFHTSQPTSADSTGLAIAAINALGEDATKAPWAQSDGDNPVKAILALQMASGSFRANKDASTGNPMSTVNAIPGLAHQSYPIEAAGRPGPTPTPAQTKKPGGTKTTAAPGSTESATVAVDSAAAPPTSHPSAHDGTTSASNKQRASAATATKTPRPTPYLLGFGGISTKPGGGLSLATWGAIAAGCTGLGVGLWFLRARLR